MQKMYRLKIEQYCSHEETIMQERVGHGASERNERLRIASKQQGQSLLDYFSSISIGLV